MAKLQVVCTSLAEVVNILPYVGVEVIGTEKSDHDGFAVLVVRGWAVPDCEWIEIAFTKDCAASTFHAEIRSLS